jgi:hypothetical protein
VPERVVLHIAALMQGTPYACNIATLAFASQ